MKKYLTTLLFLKLFFFLSYSQNIKITAMVEGECPPCKISPMVIELYIDGTMDVSQLNLQFQAPSESVWNNNISIGSGTYSDTFLYVTNDLSLFNTEFLGIGTASTILVADIPFCKTGGDKVRLINSSNGQVIDLYGYDGYNGEDTVWDFSNSYVKRNDGKGPSATFSEDDWMIYSKNSLLFKGRCWWGGRQVNKTVILGEYTLSLENTNFRNSTLKLIPNPSTDFIKVVGLKENSVKYNIYNILGQNIKTGLLHQNDRINIEDLSDGLYSLRIYGKSILKFIKL